MLSSELETIIEKILLEKIKNKETITYSELAKEINKRTGKKAVSEKGKSLGLILSKYLNKFCEKYVKERNFMIGAVVVRKDTKLPSSGFFKLAEKLYNLKLDTEETKTDFWKSEINKIFKEEI